MSRINILTLSHARSTSSLAQVAYTILLLPVTLARFYEFSGRDVPFGVTIFADFVFNLQGVVNVTLLLATRRYIPDTKQLEIFQPRKHISMSSPEAFGITPFVLPPPDADAAEKAEGSDAATAPAHPEHTHRESTSSFGSVDSQTPFVLHVR